MKVVIKKLQTGFSAMQVVAGLAIAAVVTAGAAAVMVPAYNTMILNAAFEEIIVFITAARKVREYTGSYNTISFNNVQKLVDNGYLPNPPYTNGFGQNRLGNDITFIGLGATARITYNFDGAEQCRNIEQRIDGIVDAGNYLCTNELLYITID